MPTVARLTLQVDVDGQAEAAAELQALDRILEARAARWSTLSRRFVTDTDDEGAALGRFARTGEESHDRVGRAANRDTDSHRRFSGMLGVVGQTMTRMGARVSILVNALVPLAVAAFQVGAALTPIVGLAGAIPGLLAAGGVAAGTAMLAFHGMGDALTAMAKAQDGSKASIEAMNKAMAALPPAARPVVRQLFEMRTAVAAMRQTAAAGIMPGVSVLLRSLGSLFPLVQQEIGRTAGVMGMLAERTARWTGSVAFRRDFQTLISTSSTLTRNFGGAALQLAGAFMDIAIAGQPLARQFGNLIEAGAIWVGEATASARASGALAAFFQRAGDVAERLWGIISDVVVIIVNLGRVAAPAGTGLLDMLANLLDRAARASSNLDNLRAMVGRLADTFTVLRLALLGVALGPWGAAAGAVAGILLVLYRRSETFRNVVNLIGSTIMRVAVPAFQALSGWVMGQLVPAITRVLPAVRDGLMPAFRGLASAIQQNRTQFAQAGGVILLVAGFILTRLLPVLIRVAGFIAGQLVRNITAAITIFGFLVRAISTVVGIVQTVIAAIGRFVSFTAAAWNTLRAATAAAWEAVRRAVVGAVGQAWTTIRTVFGAVTGFMSRTGDAITRVTRATWDFFYQLIFANIARVVAEVRKSIGGLIPQSIRNAWTSSTRATRAAWDQMVSFVAGSIRRLLGILTAAWATMLRAVRDTWNRLTGIIRAGWSTVSRSTSDAWGRLRNTVADGTRRIMATITGWGRDVRGFFGRLVTDMLGFGRRMWNNVLSGIRGVDLIGGIRGLLNRVVNTLNSFGRGVARVGNILLPGDPIQWPGIPQLRQRGGEIFGLARGDRVPVMAEGGEVMIRNQVAQPLRGMLLALNSLPASSARALAREIAGSRTPDVAGDIAHMVLSRNTMSRPDRQGISVPMRFAAGGEIPRLSGLIGRVQSWVRGQDPKPYIWGGAGPGGFDCSGLTGAVYAALTGRGYGSGQRYFTTASNFGAVGFRPGRGTYTIGVSPGHHMAGNLAGLGFEARGRASGILTGPAARSVTSFPRTFYLPQAGGRFIGAGGGIDFLGILTRFLNAILRPARAGLSAVGGGPENLAGALAGGIGTNLVDALADWVKGGTGMQWGGNITEPIFGIGRRSGQPYHFGERGTIERYRPAGAAAGGGDVLNFNVSLTGTYAEPITMGDVHRAIGTAVGMLRANRARTAGVGRT